MRDAFSGCLLIDSIPNLNQWDISNVTSLYRTFYNLQSFNQDLNNWNTSNVDTMQETFYNNHLLNGDITTWDVSNVKTMGIAQISIKILMIGKLVMLRTCLGYFKVILSLISH